MTIKEIFQTIIQYVDQTLIRRYFVIHGKTINYRLYIQINEINIIRPEKIRYIISNITYN